MERAYTHGKTVGNMKEITIKIKKKGLEYIHGLMVRNM